jgi:MFS family permease
MATVEKDNPIAREASETADSDTPGFRPKGWMYKTIRLGRLELWYASPKVQLFMVSIVCFLCPGMFNALTGLGGGGQVSNEAQDHANTALYSTFAVVGFFAGTFANRLGLRLTLSIGGLGYCVYAASFLCYTHTQNMPFVVFAGALLGVCAGLLWAAQGSIMMSYPPEQSKGRYISWFWVIFNMGAVIGSLVSLIYINDSPDYLLNFHYRSPLLKMSTRKQALSPMELTPLSSLSWPLVPSSPFSSATPTRSFARTTPKSSS